MGWRKCGDWEWVCQWWVSMSDGNWIRWSVVASQPNQYRRIGTCFATSELGNAVAAALGQERLSWPTLTTISMSVGKNIGSLGPESYHFNLMAVPTSLKRNRYLRNLQVDSTPTPNAVEALHRLLDSEIPFRLCSNFSRGSFYIAVIFNLIAG